YDWMNGVQTWALPISEAWLNTICGEYFEAQSAGLEPGTLNPLAVQVMAEAGIDISKKKTQAVFDVFVSGQLFAYVITVCDEASEIGRASCSEREGFEW